MSGWPFRFVHASDLHLELPLFGVAEVPPHLRDTFIEAPLSAARRVFDTVLAEEAEFLVLAGDVLSPFDAGPRGVAFLLGQFERLHARDIPVYWATGRVDSVESWPSAGTLPPNVHLLSRGRTSDVMHQRRDEPLARLIGVSRQATGHLPGYEFAGQHVGLFTIGVAHGAVEPEMLHTAGIHYWALGGEHERRFLDHNSPLACYCGSPQGRQPAEVGPHGCLVVHVDDHHVRPAFIETDTVRWRNEHLEFGPETRRSDLEEQLSGRLTVLRSTDPHAVWLVTWTLSGNGPLLGTLRHGGLDADLLAGLREEFGHGEVPCWSVEIVAEPSVAPAAQWQNEDTILGEFLRRVDQLDKQHTQPIELSRVLSEAQVAGSIASLVQLDDADNRRHVLHRVKHLGAELLRGEEAAAVIS
ncbi:MAG: metallophosphoesterase [Planctomycetia bacterium]|nr:metallophosphoesterase [Planctomycetia bacterium]